jgi:predicted DNA-binding transcriptional regulator
MEDVALRLLLGYGLVGVSLFMLLGFFNADVGSGVARALALLIGVGIPGAAGAVLLTQHYGGKRRLAGSREELKRKTQEAELLRMAGEHGGRLTVVEVVRELAMGQLEAESTLRSLVERGICEVEVTDRGLLVYSFPDVKLLGEKHTSRGVLDG